MDPALQRAAVAIDPVTDRRVPIDRPGVTGGRQLDAHCDVGEKRVDQRVLGVELGHLLGEGHDGFPFSGSPSLTHISQVRR